MDNKLSMNDLLEAGVHFGHQVRRGHPRMKPYIYGAREGVHIIDLTKSEEYLKEAEGLKAFFLNDPSRALNEFQELKQLDLDHSGTIETSELLMIKNKNVKLGLGDRFLEAFSTHPNMLKRIQHLSQLGA